MEVVIIIGSQASGKSTLSNKYKQIGYTYLNRDSLGYNAKIKHLYPLLESALKRGENVVIDNTHPTIKSRSEFIKIAKQFDCTVTAQVMTTSIEDCQLNAVSRMIKKYGKLINNEDIKQFKDSNLFPIAVLFNYRNIYEAPTLFEGFNSIEYTKFSRVWGDEYNSKALFLDYDGTIRETISGEFYPRTPADVKILPNRIKKLIEYQRNGYKLFGISNQSGIHKGLLTHEQTKDCFDKTNKLLGLDIEYAYCPHASAPITCYCRKPSVGMVAFFIEKYKISTEKSKFVGNAGTDRTCANRIGIKYYEKSEFFNKISYIIK